MRQPPRPLLRSAASTTDKPTRIAVCAESQFCAQQRANPDMQVKSDGFGGGRFAMSAMSHQQSLAQTWKRRQRRQRILVAVVIVALLAALIYGWLHVFGIF